MEFEARLREIADKVTVALDQLIPPADGPEADL
ncbi:MAG: polyprenyl synthetase family protein, partial [Pseudomonadota bacterium]